jgi:hypothetical protein
MLNSPYLRALHTAVHGAGLPYGYALTVWSTGAAVANKHGLPSPGTIFLFLAGAATGYGVLRLLTWITEEEADRPLTRSPNVVRAGAVHVAAIGLAATAAMLCARISGDIAWLLAPLASTLAYLGIASVEVALLERGDIRPEVTARD